MAVKATTKPTGAAEEGQAENNASEGVRAEYGENNEARRAEETLTLAYIGPSLPAGQLKSNKIMIGTMEEIKTELKEVLGKYPLIEKMLVPVEELAEKKDKVRTAGNVLNKYYSDIVSSIAVKAAKEG